MIYGIEETCKRAPLRIRPPEELLADWGFEGAWARKGGCVWVDPVFMGKGMLCPWREKWLEQKTTYIITIHCEKETLVVKTEI
jgi:hypothetical protein